MNLNNLLENNLFILIRILKHMRKIGIELSRANEVADVLIDLGLSLDDKDILNYVEETKKQFRQEESWTGIGKTIFSLALLSHTKNGKDTAKYVRGGIDWIFRCQNKDGGIGRFRGDRSRIPVCWRVIETLKKNDVGLNPNIKRIFRWMEQEWSLDMTRGGLTYKCAGILIANKHYSNIFSNLFIKKSINWLLNEQNEDGGWGPKNNAPAGSIPSYTGLALRALNGYSGNAYVKTSLKKGINWIGKNRLKTGLWREHPAEKAIIEISLFLSEYLKNED